MITRRGVLACRTSYVVNVIRSNKTNVESPLKESYLNTNHFQRSLPNLKVPKLDRSLERYLASQKALLNNNELESTKEIVTEFRSFHGPKLQQLLENYAECNPNTSYISKLWFDMYLKDRRPVVLTHNPGLLLRDIKPNSDYSHPIIRATNMVFSAIRFYKLLKSNSLSPEVYYLNQDTKNSSLFQAAMRFIPKSKATYGAYAFKAFPLDMSQFQSMFNTTRVPQPDKDVIRTYEDTKPNNKHLLVISKGQYYVFDLIDEFEQVIEPAQLLSNLQFIASQPEPKQKPSILGTLTTMSRPDAYVGRQRLIQTGNADNIKQIDSALFVLVLEHSVQENAADMIKNILAGPPESRWFDKSFSLIVNSTSGQVSVNFEHSWGDGVAMIRFVNDIVMDSDLKPVVNRDLLENSEKLPVSKVRRLEWILDDYLMTELIIPNKRLYEQRCDQLSLNVLEKQTILSKNMCKKAGLSPDAVLQLSLQLSYHLLHNKMPAAYESCSTSAFKHGRTETLRSVTVETRNFINLMLKSLSSGTHISADTEPITNGDKSVNLAELQEALKLCSKKHSQLSKEAAMGQGWDRHLFALRTHASNEFGSKLPKIFTDPNYININNIVLSTSTLSAYGVVAGSFAAVTPDGYGVAYGIEDEHCGLVCTSWRDAPSASSEQFVQAFRESIGLIGNVVQSLVQ